MKKLLLVAAAALLSFSLSAQIYVGGSLSFTATGSNDKVADTQTSSTSFRVSPNVGMILSDDLCAGVYANLSFGSPAKNSGNFSVGLTPYARYRLLSYGKFNLLAEGGAHVGFSNAKTTTPGTGYTKTTSTLLGLYVEPVVTYPLTDHITLEAALNLVNLNWTGSFIKSVTHINTTSSNTTTIHTADSRFNVGADSGDIFGGGVGAVTIGFTYKF